MLLVAYHLSWILIEMKAVRDLSARYNASSDGQGETQTKRRESLVK